MVLHSDRPKLNLRKDKTMERHASNAFNTLKKMGAPVFIHEGESYYFVISAEENYDTVWADYYAMTDGSYGDLCDFGVNESINKVLNDNGLFCEWQNPGVLAVYDA